MADSQVGTIIREKREAKGLSRKELAQLIGMTTEVIRLYEIGERNPSRTTLYNLSTVLEFPTDELRHSVLERGRGPARNKFHRKLIVSAGSSGNFLFGSLLRDLRKLNKLEPKDLAELAAVHVSFVNGIERGVQAPSLITAQALFAPLTINSGIEWNSEEADLLLTDPLRDGEVFAFDFKAEVRGQNRREGSFPKTKGFWLVYSWDNSKVAAEIAFTDELEALRYAVKHNSLAAFVSFGEDILELVKKEEGE